jgi:hypothetical protein
MVLFSKTYVTPCTEGGTARKRASSNATARERHCGVMCTLAPLKNAIGSVLAIISGNACPYTPTYILKNCTNRLCCTLE